MWISVFGYPEDSSREDFIAEKKTSKDLPSGAQTISLDSNKYGYYFKEERDRADEVWSLQSFSFGKKGHMVMSVYFDKEEDLTIAKSLWANIKETEYNN